MIAVSLSALALAIWIYLVFARGGFWLGRERDDTTPSRLAVPPKVAIVVPARNEADNIARARNVAAYVPAEFANPQLELLIILPKT